MHASSLGRAIATCLLTPLLILTASTCEKEEILDNTEKILYHSTEDSLYRIPAIAVTNSGTILAISDYRHDHGSDVGAKKPIDVMIRRSLDKGHTWEPEMIAVNCNSPEYADGIYGFGDAALVADRDTDEQLLICVGDRDGKTYGNGGHLEIHSFRSHDNGRTWGEHADLTDQIYGINTSWKTMFIGSGKIFQSRVVKVSKYYRIYCAALVKNYGNAIIYSDDFGVTWSFLGGTKTPCKLGDEAKVEELPDGTVILSSRTYEGRLFNLYYFDDLASASGHWGTAVNSSAIVTESNSTNGEIMAVSATDAQSGKKCWVYLQSVPAGPSRSHVSIYYKAMPLQDSYQDETPSDFAAGWSKFEVTDLDSSYSTMCQMKDGRIAFLYERKDLDVNGYDIVFVPFSLSSITSGQYK